MSRRIQNPRKKASPMEEMFRLTDRLLKVTTGPQEKRIGDAFKNVQEIVEIVQRIRSTEERRDKDIDVTHRGSGATIDSFVKWLEENGAKFSGLTIANFEGYDLGLRANEDVTGNSLLITIPKQLMITVENARESTLSSLAKKDMLLKNMDSVILSVFILMESCNHTSFWKPYIDILPKTYSTVLYYDIEELNELHGSPALEEALKQIKNIARQYAYLFKLIWRIDDPVCKILRKQFTFDRYRWAVSTVMTRNNTIPSENNDSEAVPALIPLWDLCNHRNGRLSTDYNPELKRSECYAMEDFKKGEQIFIFYGVRRNDEFFVYNGFVYEDNEHDGYTFHLGISKNDPLINLRIKLLNKLGILGNCSFVLEKGDEPIEQKLLAFSRIFSMNEEQLGEWIKNETAQDLLDAKFCFNSDFEKKYWGFLLARLKLLQAIYKTSLDEDLKLLTDQSTSISTNKRLAIRLRVAEKRILKNAQEYVTKRLENLP